MEETKRAAGILLALSSLPSEYGIGSFGETARQWVDFLYSAGQKHWQILPLNPTSWGDSPYQSFSAFAISPYYIDLDALLAQGLLMKDELAGTNWGQDAGQVDYAALYREREPVLRKAFSRFKSGADYERFCAEQAFWLRDYALFMALKQKNNGRSWLEWEQDLRMRESAALVRAETTLENEQAYHTFVQYMAFSQWKTIKDYANGRGIGIIGDIPIYVAMDSADVWANSELFLLDEQRRPIRVAGCPPDSFAAGGQLWGNPLYRWDRLDQSAYAWWLSRLRAGFALYDTIRIDHFRGFESYYAIPAGDPDAIGGYWEKGPGFAFINAVQKAMPQVAIIAEDLGYLTQEVRDLLAASGYPGMKVLQFAFDSREPSNYMPYTYERNCVVYSGTHDNITSAGWFTSAPAEDIEAAKTYFGFRQTPEKREASWAFIRAALSSVANLAIIPMQDYLGLGSEARMNTPSTLGGSNWQWRLQPDALGNEAARALAGEIHAITALNGRCPY